MMKYTRLRVAATIIALIVGIGFLLSVPHTHDVKETPKVSTAPQSIPVVTLQDSFKNNLHTIIGTVTAPNACTIVTANATVSGDASSTQSILVALSMPPDTGICLQLPTPVDFKTTVTAPAHLPFVVTVNGVIASTTAS